MAETIRKVSNNWTNIFAFVWKVIWVSKARAECAGKHGPCPCVHINWGNFLFAILMRSLHQMCDEHKIRLFSIKEEENMWTSGQATVLVVVAFNRQTVFMLCVEIVWTKHTHIVQRSMDTFRGYVFVCEHNTDQFIVANAFELHNRTFLLINRLRKSTNSFVLFLLRCINSSQWLNRSLVLQVKEYKDGLIKKAETLITIGFPEKIVQLNELLETEMFANRNLHDVHQASDT